MDTELTETPAAFLSPVLLKGLQEVMSSSQTSSGQGSPASSSLQIRLTRLEESSGGSSPAPSPVAALQIPVQIPLQITHVGENLLSVSG